MLYGRSTQHRVNKLSRHGSRFYAQRSRLRHVRSNVNQDEKRIASCADDVGQGRTCNSSHFPPGHGLTSRAPRPYTPPAVPVCQNQDSS